MKKLLVITVFMLSLNTACVSVPNTSQTRDVRNTEEQLAIYQTNQPVPRFAFSQQRDTLIQIYVLQNEARATFTTFHSNGTGDVIFACPSRGYAIPADTQLTNPVQIAFGGTAVFNGSTSRVGDYGVIDQPEPNGLYSSKNTDGTWVICVRENGEAVPVYSELKVQTFPFEVSWDEARRMLFDMKKQSSSSLTIRSGRLESTPVSSPVPLITPTR